MSEASSVSSSELCTPLGPLPLDWKIITLKDVSLFITKGTTPTTYGFDWVDDGVPFLRSECVAENGFILSGLSYITEKANSYLRRSEVRAGDILITITGNVGRVVIYPSFLPGGNINQHIARVRIINFEELDSIYAAYILNSQIYKDYYLKITTGLAYPQISLEQVRDSEIPCPPLAQQQKIAKILSTVDKLIEKTQTLIDKYTAIKQGMMADLFTRGIDMTTGDTPNSNGGKLRPSVEDAPELYKQTELGWVPKEWEVCSLKEKIEGDGFVQTGPFGSQLHSYEYVEAGVPVIMPQDIIEGIISFEKIAQITAGKANSLSRHKVKANDVVFSRRGDLTRSAYIANELNNIGFICGTGCLLLRVSKLIVHGGWFSTLYGTRFIQSQVDGLAVGTTMANLNSKILGKLKIAFPPVKEQEEAYLRIDLIDRELKLLQSEVTKRQEIKKGLMQDLLTGKVKVA